MQRPDGTSITYAYDSSSGFLKTTTIPQGALSTTFNSAGQLVSTSMGGRQGTFHRYDGFLPVHSEWEGSIVYGSTDLTFDANFRVVSQAINSSQSPIAFAYDRDGLMTQAASETITRDPSNGRITRAILGNIEEDDTYDAYGLFASSSATYEGNVLYAESVLRDDDGRITQKTETFGTDTHVTVYGYDARGPLTDVTTDGTATAHYGYDANDNRTTVTDGVGSASPTYDAQDRLVTYGAASFTFNAAGELTGRTDASGTTSFTYDPLGNLLNVTLPSKTVDYLIDGEQRRVGKELNGSLQFGYLYRDDLRVVAKVAVDGYGQADATYSLLAHYAYGTKSNVPDVIVGGPYGPGLWRILSDHLGSVRLVVNTSTGAIVQRMDYDAFGNVTSDTNPGFTPFGFAGGLYDPDTKLVRFGARDYDPSVGRWTTKDPSKFHGGLNLYGYTSNDPIDFTDPDGHGPRRYAKCVQTMVAAGYPTKNFGEVLVLCLAWMWVPDPKEPKYPCGYFPVGSGLRTECCEAATRPVDDERERIISEPDRCSGNPYTRNPPSQNQDYQKLDECLNEPEYVPL